MVLILDGFSEPITRGWSKTGLFWKLFRICDFCRSQQTDHINIDQFPSTRAHLLFPLVPRSAHTRDMPFFVLRDFRYLIE